MSTEENKVLVRRQSEDVWNNGDRDAMLTYWDEIPAADLLHGHTLLHTAFPDFHITIEDIIAEGDKVVTRMLFHGRHQGPFFGIPPTGKYVEWCAIRIYRIADGKLVETWAMQDRLGLMQQLGAAPPPARS
jgi:predicted ester cyclase